MAKYPRKNTLKKSKVKRATSMVPKIYKAYVNRAIGKNIETKQVMYSLPPTYFNSGISSGPDFCKVIPAVVTGPGQTGRIGDTIMPEKIVVRGYVNYGSNSYQSAQELIARLFCFQDKSVKTWTLVDNVPAILLDSGGSGSLFTGSLINSVTPHNKDHYTFFKDVKHKFFKPYGYTNNSVVTTAIVSMSTSCIWEFTITLTKKHLPKYFKYDSSDYPINFCPIIALGYCYAQNDAPDTSSTQLLMSYTSTLYYKDA